MKTQHTPGPWRVVPADGHGDSLYSIGTSNSEHTLANVWYCPAEGEGWHEVDAANARLIAAAPELLAALQSLIGSVSEHKEHYCDTADWEDAQDRVETAKAAIAKATQP